jgi:hypothetical protein
MTAKAEIPELERRKFFMGQPLRAADLTELERANRELRWLHNRSLHGWGIGVGLGVTGDRGDTRVSVDPGYAVDCLGREMVLTAATTMKVPADAAGSKGAEAVYYLTIAYLSDADQKVAERRAGVCRPSGTVRLEDKPRIEWRKTVREGVDIPLAQAWVKNCQLSRSLSLAVRRSARSSGGPYFASGQTTAEKTRWEEWRWGNDTVGVFAKVDTSRARFNTTPHYVAHVGGERSFKGNSSLILVDGLVQIAEADRNGFELRVLMPRGLDIEGVDVNPTKLFSPGGHSTITQFVKTTLGWHVIWMGIEP